AIEGETSGHDDFRQGASFLFRRRTLRLQHHDGSRARRFRLPRARYIQIPGPVAPVSGDRAGHAPPGPIRRHRRNSSTASRPALRNVRSAVPAPVPLRQPNAASAPTSSPDRLTLVPASAEWDWDQWVSASRTRNYVLDNPLADWLDLY